MARATCSLARACLLLVAARAAAAAAFTQGNVLVLEAGDGTLAGSAAPSNASTNDHNSASAVSASFFEYSINQQTGVLTATGNVVALPAATLTSGLTLLGNVADVGNSVGTYMPYSGSLSLATDGSNLAFVGYQQPAGSLVGPSCMCYSLTSAAVNLDTPISLSLPANTVNRVIGWIDASGTVRTVNGNLNTVLGAYTINSAIWYANGPANSGFYVTGGYSFQSSGGVGGIYWVPMPSGIGGPQGTPVLVCLTPAYTATNFKMYNCECAALLPLPCTANLPFSALRRPRDIQQLGVYGANNGWHQWRCGTAAWGPANNVAARRVHHVWDAYRGRRGRSQ